MFRLDGKVAIVTGASSGLGVAFAKALAEAGADVVLGARRVERLEDTGRLVEETGRRALAVQTDVASPEDCQRLVDAAVNEFGRVDVLVNNAGIGTAVPATRETPEQFRSVIDVNLNGCCWMAQACGRDLAQQWTGRKGIRVNALAPGFFDSEMTEQYPDGYLESMIQRAPVGGGSRAGARGRAGVPGQRRGRLRDRSDPRRRRRDDDHLTGSRQSTSPWRT